MKNLFVHLPTFEDAGLTTWTLQPSYMTVQILSTTTMCDENFQALQHFDYENNVIHYARGILRLVDRVTGKLRFEQDLRGNSLALSTDENCVVFGNLDCRKAARRRIELDIEKMSLQFDVLHSLGLSMKVRRETDCGFIDYVFVLARCPVELSIAAEQMIILWPSRKEIERRFSGPTT